jgi:hypothetical protein
MTVLTNYWINIYSNLKNKKKNLMDDEHCTSAKLHDSEIRVEYLELFINKTKISS